MSGEKRSHPSQLGSGISSQVEVPLRLIGQASFLTKWNERLGGYKPGNTRNPPCGKLITCTFYLRSACTCKDKPHTVGGYFFQNTARKRFQREVLRSETVIAATAQKKHMKNAASQNHQGVPLRSWGVIFLRKSRIEVTGNKLLGTQWREARQPSQAPSRSQCSAPEQWSKPRCSTILLLYQFVIEVRSWQKRIYTASEICPYR